MKFISTSKAPKPQGPYSQGISTESMVFVSGTIGIDPTTGKLGKDIKEQTRLALENIKAILEEGGSSLDRIVKCSVFIKDASFFKDMNEVYEKCMGNHRPTRTTVVCGFAKDDILVEIDAIALK